MLSRLVRLVRLGFQMNLFGPLMIVFVVFVLKIWLISMFIMCFATSNKSSTMQFVKVLFRELRDK